VSTTRKLALRVATGAFFLLSHLGCSENDVDLRIIHPDATSACTSGTDLFVGYTFTGGEPLLTSKTLTCDGVARTVAWTLQGDSTAPGRDWWRCPLSYDVFGDSCQVTLCWSQAWDVLADDVKCASSEVFTIVEHPRYITVVWYTPKPVRVGQTQSFGWRSYGPSNDWLRIDLVDTLLTHVLTIEDSTEDDGLYDWLVDSLYGTFQIRLTRSVDSVSGLSYPFEILP
jgi:hypothetical protein